MNFKKIFIFIFILFLSTPMLLGGVYKLVNKKLDVDLYGYVAPSTYPVFSLDNYLSGQFQNGYEAWINDNMISRGVLTKTYSQMQYTLFNKADEIFLKNDNVISTYFISEICKFKEYDFSQPDRIQEMENFVNHCESVQKKLEEKGKYFLIYTAPAKAETFYEDIPDKYVDYGNKDGVRAIDCFRNLVSQRDINYYDAKDTIDNYSADAPLFYSSGIHWAKPIEQEISNDVISHLEQISGMKHRKVVLKDIISSENVIYRENDLFLLSNLWQSNKTREYYQYKTKREYPEQYDKLRILLQGDSFSDGIRKDIFENYYGDDEYSFFYNQSVTEANGVDQYGISTWDEVDIAHYLNNVDYVVVEINDGAWLNYSSGFIEYLDSYLDNYIPQEEKIYDLDRNFDAINRVGLKYNRGCYGFEGDFIWTTEDCYFRLQNPNISEYGLKLDFSVPDKLLENEDETIYIYVNQKLVYSECFHQAGEGEIVISPDKLPTAEDDVYEIEIFSNYSFTPVDCGWGEDTRKLAFQLFYVGENYDF